MQCVVIKAGLKAALKVRRILRTSANYSLTVEVWLHQQVVGKATRSDAATSISALLSPWTAAGLSSGLACRAWSPQEAEDSQSAEGLGLCLRLQTWYQQLRVTGFQTDEHNLCTSLLSSGNSAGFVCQLIKGFEGTPARLIDSSHTSQCDLSTQRQQLSEHGRSEITFIDKTKEIFKIGSL